MTRRTTAGAGVLLLLAASSPASAQNVDITFNDQATRLLGDQLEIAEAELESRIREQLAATYGLVDVPEFLRLSGNAQNMANKGLGVDYASDPDYFVFGVAVNFAADAGDADIEALRDAASFDLNRAVPVGSGAQIALMAGVNLGFIGLDDFMLYASGLYYPLETSGLDGTFWNLGAHLQYSLFDPVGASAIVQWQGIRLTSGLQMSRMLLELEEVFEASYPIGGGIDVDTESTGVLQLEQRALTVPVEATTGLQLFYFLTLYGGIGMDVLFGEASMNFDLDTDLSTQNPVDGERLEVGNAQLTVDEAGDPDSVVFRFITGLQVNVGPVHAFAQLNLHTTDLTVGLAAGARVAW